MWAEVKSRGAHFLNTGASAEMRAAAAAVTIAAATHVPPLLCLFSSSFASIAGFDVWPDVELDLNLLDDLKKHASFKAGAGRTCVFSFGCNPGIASHFVRHGLRAVTGCTDMKAAAAAFGLRAIIFAERDTQWPVRGSKEEKLIEDTQTTVLYNTWSPGNYIVETVESTILYAGCPPEATKINAAGPAVTAGPEDAAPSGTSAAVAAVARRPAGAARAAGTADAQQR